MPTTDLIQLQTYVPPDLAERVKAAADQDERSIAAYIRRLLARELEPVDDVA
jgi:predicted DNA-binding protein